MNGEVDPDCGGRVVGLLHQADFRPFDKALEGAEASFGDTCMLRGQAGCC